MKGIKKPALFRVWANCPYCGQKTILHDDTANANGIWIKCKRCGREHELVLENGKQINKPDNKH